MCPLSWYISDPISIEPRAHVTPSASSYPRTISIPIAPASRSQLRTRSSPRPRWHAAPEALAEVPPRLECHSNRRRKAPASDHAEKWQPRRLPPAWPCCRPCRGRDQGRLQRRVSYMAMQIMYKYVSGHARIPIYLDDEQLAAQVSEMLWPRAGLGAISRARSPDGISNSPFKSESNLHRTRALRRRFRCAIDSLQCIDILQRIRYFVGAQRALSRRPLGTRRSACRDGMPQEALPVAFADPVAISIDDLWDENVDLSPRLLEVRFPT